MKLRVPFTVYRLPAKAVHGERFPPKADPPQAETVNEKFNAMMLNRNRSIHFVGIGGIGMSAIAKVFLEMGYKISGSDLHLNHLTRDLEASGARIFEGHRASNLPGDSSVLVYSSSVPADNPEIKEAGRRKINIAHRAQVLGWIFNKKKGIGVTGTHGKTTTTSLISVMLKAAGRDPTVIIGGECDEFGANGALGRGEYLVAEADESDSSFLNLRPAYAVITNIEMEHVDHFRTLEDAKGAYRAFARNVKTGGRVFYNADDANCVSALEGLSKDFATFGMSKKADIYPRKIRMEGFRTSFECVYKGCPLGKMELVIPGRHNITNALAASLVGLKVGISFKEIAASIKDFRGARRRFQLRAQDAGGAMLIEDYAHHPTEIEAVLDTCRNWKGKRVVAIFQPHRYTRTKYLAEGFGKSLAGADKLLLTDIYAASEKPIKGVSIKNIVNKVTENGLKDVIVMKKENIPGYIMNMKKPDDMIVVLGAGDIKTVADRLSSMMSESHLAGLKRSLEGRLELNKSLAARTTLRIGGPADIWVEPAGLKDLRNVLKFAKARKVPLSIIGNGSNILAADAGFRGIMVCLGAPYFKGLAVSGKAVRVGAGMSLAKLVRWACENGFGGFESLVGIPGTVGGAIFMNAGGSTNPIFKNIGDLVLSLKVMDYDGRIRKISRHEIEFRYRGSNLAPYIILEAVLRLERADRGTCLAQSAQFLKMKRDKQVLDIPSAGCIFKNPKHFQFTCGQMIDMLGLKGRQIGGAQISEKHANFIINRGGATCKDVTDLIKFIRNKAKENYGVDLELEVKVI
jgi:UDP-N-acetylmuramate--alanine ligase